MNLGLNLRDYEILQCLLEGPLSQSTIAARLNSYKASVSRGVSHLSERGWVTCRRRPSDKRICLVEVTDEGSRRLQTAQAGIASVLSKLNASLGTKEQSQLIRIIEYTKLLPGVEMEPGSS